MCGIVSFFDLRWILYIWLIFKVHVIPITHQKDASQTFFDAIPITNHNVLGIVSLFASRWVLHIRFIFQIRCNTHHAPKICITNFIGCNTHHEAFCFWNCIIVRFATGIAYVTYFLKDEAIHITHRNEVELYLCLFHGIYYQF